MTPNNYPEGLDELATEVADNIPECVRGDSHWDRLYDFEPAELRDYARALLDALAERGYVLVDAKKQEPVAWMCCVPGQETIFLDDEPSDARYPKGFKEPLYTRPFVAAPAEVLDFEPDAKRLALELECLLLDCRDMAAVSKWWDSAHEALEQHRAMLSAATTPPTLPQGDGSLRRELLKEVHLINDAYIRIRAERVFAADDLEYDLFAAGWKAAIDAAMEARNG